MKISHVDGSQTETESLNDIEKLILEKADELRKICLNSNRQCLILVDPSNRYDGSFMTFWTLASKKYPNITEENITEEIWLDAISNILCGINNYVSSVSQNKLKISET